jgi:hypothetical protein
VVAPPPGQNMICTNVRCLPSFVSSAWADVWKLSASGAEMGLSLNQFATEGRIDRR